MNEEKELPEWFDELTEYESLDDFKKRMSLLKSRRGVNNIIITSNPESNWAKNFIDEKSKNN